MTKYEIINQVDDHVEERISKHVTVNSNLWAQIPAQVYDLVSVQLWGPIYNQVKIQCGDHVENQVRDIL